MIDLTTLIAKKLSKGLSATDVCQIELETHPGLSSRQFYWAVKSKLPPHWNESHVHRTLARLAESGRAVRRFGKTTDTWRLAAHWYPTTGA